MSTKLRRTPKIRPDRYFEDVHITQLVQTCGGCPSQWNARGPDGEFLYISLRNGGFSVHVNEEMEFSDFAEGFDGVMTTEQMLEFTGFVADSIGDECDECKRFIPVVDGGGLANKHHEDSCSLYDPKED